MSFERRRSGRDRRQGRRVNAVFAVKNRIGYRLQLGQAEDIAPAGMTLRRPKDTPVALDTPMAMTFELPGTGTPIDVGGQVVSDNRDGSFRRTGVRFTRVAPEHADLIAQYCGDDPVDS